MNLHNLKPAKGSTHNSKRVGRGQGSGKGGTAKKGTKGAQSRTGYSSKIGFEGGQMPLQRRIPKFGFKNPFRVEYVGINLDVLEKLSQQHKVQEFTPEVFNAHGLTAKRDKIKILGRGELKAKVTVKAHAFSETATKAIEAAGGKAEKV